MDAIVFYVVRQRNGWSVERDRVVQSGHADREAAIACARKAVAEARAKGLSSRLRIQEEAGLWREERSFARRAEVLSLPRRGPKISPRALLFRC